MRLVGLSIMALAMTANAAPATMPRMTPFLQMPGIPLGGNIAGAAFCEASQRAVFRLDSSHVVAVDAAGTITSLGNIGVVPFPTSMVCDRKDRVVVGGGKKLVTLANHTATTIPIAADVRHMRILDDGSIGIVDAAGAVHRFDGTALTELWSAKRALPSPMELDGKAEQILTSSGGRVQITTQTGPHQGPHALTATWLDNTTVLFGDRAGLISKWATDAPQDRYSRVAQIPLPDATTRGRVFVRANFQRAGSRRILVQRNTDGPVLALELDAQQAVTASTLISRIPQGRRFFAAGDATFGIFAVNDRALVVDLTRPSFAVSHQHPLAVVDTLAFSPDGRELAMFGGDRDLLVASLDRSATRRLHTATGLVRGKLVWSPDGTLFTTNFSGQIRWNLDGTVEDRSRDLRATGFTPNGLPITLTRDSRLVIDRGHSEQSFQLPDPTFGVSNVELVHDHLLLIRGSKGAEVYDLRNPTQLVVRAKPRTFLREVALLGTSTLVYVDNQSALVLAEPSGERVIGKIPVGGFPRFAVTADTKRLAVASKDVVTIYDEHGREVTHFLASSSTLAVAWSPDLRTLAVATRTGIELWTIPR